MKSLTVFTPTYNRANLLPKAYESLKMQANKDFVWLIIDDGSNDNTEEVIEGFIKENCIKIEYYKKENGGKHTAFNFATGVIKTPYTFISLDSDDILYDENVVDKIIATMNNLKSNEVGCITLCTNTFNSMEKNDFCEKYDVKILDGKSLKWASENNQYKAECRMTFKTEYLKNFLYPTVKGERFFTEAYVYYQMDQPMVWLDMNSCYSEYLDDGLSKNFMRLFANNPNAWFLYNELRMKKNKNFFLRIKYTIYYISFGIMAKRKIFRDKITENIKILLLYPFGIMGYLFFKRKEKNK